MVSNNFLWWENQRPAGDPPTRLTGKVRQDVEDILQKSRPAPIYIPRLSRLLGFNRKATLRLLRCLGWALSDILDGMEKEEARLYIENLIDLVIAARGLPTHLRMDLHPQSEAIHIALHLALVEYAYDSPPDTHQDGLRKYFDTYHPEYVTAYHLSRQARERELKGG